MRFPGLLLPHSSSEPPSLHSSKISPAPGSHHVEGWGTSVWGLTRGWDNSILGDSVLESSSALFLPCCVAFSQSSSSGTSAVWGWKGKDWSSLRALPAEMAASEIPEAARCPHAQQ